MAFLVYKEKETVDWPVDSVMVVYGWCHIEGYLVTKAIQRWKLLSKANLEACFSSYCLKVYWLHSPKSTTISHLLDCVCMRLFSFLFSANLLFVTASWQFVVKKFPNKNNGCVFAMQEKFENIFKSWYSSFFFCLFSSLCVKTYISRKKKSKTVIWPHKAVKHGF